MPDKKQSENPEEHPSTTLTVAEWIELMNKHDRLNQYAKKRREKNGGVDRHFYSLASSIAGCCPSSMFSPQAGQVVPSRFGGTEISDRSQ